MLIGSGNPGVSARRHQKPLSQASRFMLKSCFKLVFMNAFKNPAKCLFLIYFMMNSLVFFGQDLTVRKDTDRSWCITLAEHSQAAWTRSSSPVDFLGHSSQSCGHKHQGHEVHICVDHHKFLNSLKTPGLPGSDNIKSFSLVPCSESRFVADCLWQNSLTVRGHDPGLSHSQATLSSILLL